MSHFCLLIGCRLGSKKSRLHCLSSPIHLPISLPTLNPARSHKKL